MEKLGGLKSLDAHAICLQGVSTGDNDRLTRNFFELAHPRGRWRFFQSVAEGTKPYGDQFDRRSSSVASSASVRPAVRGEAAWGKTGIIFGQMRHLPYGVYTGEWYSNSAPVMIPVGDRQDLISIWAFVNSGGFLEALRKIN